MVETLTFLPLPLFMFIRLIRGFTQPHAGGATVAPAAVYVSSREVALEMGAILGRARPDLVELLITCNSHRPNDPAVRASVAKEAEDLLANAGNPETFGDLLVLTPDEVDTYMADAVMDVKDIAEMFEVYVMLGLEFGVQQPALTRTFVENNLARIADPSGIPQPLENAGLQFPGADFRSYEQKEQAVLAMADNWRSQWGPKVEEWLLTQGVPYRLRDFLA